MCNRGGKVVDECLSIANELATAEEKLARSKKSWKEILPEFEAVCIRMPRLTAGSSFESSTMKWNFYQVICPRYLCLVRTGQSQISKHLYLWLQIVGRFMLSQLKSIYNTFCHPTTRTFAWVGAEHAEIILLNDFRLKPSIIAWSDLLQLLKGISRIYPHQKILQGEILNSARTHQHLQRLMRQLY